MKKSIIPLAETAECGLYAARIGDCRACELRAQWQDSPTTLKPRRVSAVFWPVTANQTSTPVQSLPEPPPTMLAPLQRLPVLWGDWPRCHLRRRWMQVVRTELVTLT